MKLVKTMMSLKSKYGADYELIPVAHSDFYAARIECRNYEEYSAIASMLYRKKSIHIETHLNTKTITVMLLDEWNIWKKEEDERMAAVNDWWMRYHEADDETRRLMACGKIA